MATRVTDAKKGMVLKIDGELFQITKYDHVTPGNWRAIHHLYLKNLRTGRQKEVRMNTSDTIDVQFLDTRNCQYVYKDSTGHVFMDNENYDQFPLSEEVIGDSLKWIAEGDNANVIFVEGAAISLQLETSVILEVAEAEEAVKGDTVSNIQKGATLVTGAVIRVPSHIKAGDKVKVNTETGDFIGRVKE